MDQAFQWLIDREFPSKFAQTMRDGRFNGPMILDLFGHASTIKEAMEIFKEFELPLPCLLQVWGLVQAHKRAAGRSLNRNNTVDARDAPTCVNSDGAQQGHVTERHLGGTENDAENPGARDAMDNALSLIHI